MGKRVDAAVPGRIPMPAAAGREKKLVGEGFESSLRILRSQPRPVEPERTPAEAAAKAKADTKPKPDAKPQPARPAHRTDDGSATTAAVSPAQEPERVVHEQGPRTEEQASIPFVGGPAAADGSGEEAADQTGGAALQFALLAQEAGEPVAGEHASEGAAEGDLMTDESSGSWLDLSSAAMGVHQPREEKAALDSATNGDEELELDGSLSATAGLVAHQVELVEPQLVRPIEVGSDVITTASEDGKAVQGEVRPVEMSALTSANVNQEGDQEGDQGSEGGGAADSSVEIQEQGRFDAQESEVNEPVVGTRVPKRQAVEPVERPLEQIDAAAPEQMSLDQKASPRLETASRGLAAPLEQRFAEENHENIVKTIRSDLLPKGGTVRIQLDPPELGALAVRIDVRDGVVAASFETSNEDAAKLLSHSLAQLKHSLESQGVTVEKLHVQQATKDSSSASGQDSEERQQGMRDESSQQHEQQRREMLRRMWRRVAGARDEVDVTA